MCIKRSDVEINEQIDKAIEGIEDGSMYPGMSYEEGVRSALTWIIGDTDEKPMEE